MTDRLSGYVHSAFIRSNMVLVDVWYVLSAYGTDRLFVLISRRLPVLLYFYQKKSINGTRTP